jgi:UDP-N-acetyl-D-glucosamine dehydrogenase
VIGLLRQKGAEVTYHDPYISQIQHEDWEMESVIDVTNSAREADCVVIITDHASYNFNELLDVSTLVIDTRNALGDAGRDNPKVVRL